MTLISRDRIATPEALRDHALGSGRNGRLLATGNLDGLAITLQCEFSVLVHSVLSLSVRAKARNLWLYLERASTPSSLETVVSYYAINRENDEWLRHVESEVRPNVVNDLTNNELNKHPACSASRFLASRRTRSLDRRSCRPAPGQSCAGLRPRPWPCDARRRTRKTARPRHRSISRSRQHCQPACVGRRLCEPDRVTRHSRAA